MNKQRSSSEPVADVATDTGKASPFERQLERLLTPKTRLRGMNDLTVDLHRAMVRVALARHEIDGQYNLSAVARELGIRRSTLYKLLRTV